MEVKYTKICSKCKVKKSLDEFHNYSKSKDGKPIFTEYIDPIGNKHQLHKDCFKYEGYSNKPITAQISDSEFKD